MQRLIPLSCLSLTVILSAPWQSREAAISVDQATSVCLVFSSGRTLRSYLFLSRYLSEVVAVSPAFVRPCHLVPFNNSRHTLCCYISICIWFMDISVWRNVSAPLVHIKTGVPRQIRHSSTLLTCFWWWLGRDGRAACSGSPHHAFTCASTSWGWMFFSAQQWYQCSQCPSFTSLCIPYTLENNSCKLHVKTAQNLTAAELTAVVLTANLAGKKCVLVRGLLIWEGFYW